MCLGRLLAARGHTVLGVDANPQKTEFIRDGRTPIVEEQIGELIADVVAAGRLQVSEAAAAVHNSDVTIVCVGTPSGAGGSLSTEYLERASEEIGAALATKDDFHVVVYRSTMVPGTCESLLIPILERTSGKKAGGTSGCASTPSSCASRTSVKDFLDPPKTVVGESDERSGAIVMSLYDGLPGPRFRVPIAVAEMTKYVDNSFHALKVTFGNEIGAVCAGDRPRLAQGDRRSSWPTPSSTSARPTCVPASPSAGPACPRTCGRSRTPRASTTSTSRCCRTCWPPTRHRSAARWR